MSSHYESNWYTSSLYSGKSFSVKIICRSEELANMFNNPTMLTSKDEFPNTKKTLLLASGFAESFVSRIANGLVTICPNYDNLSSLFDRVFSIKSVFSNSKIMDIESIATIVNNSLNDIICVVPDIREPSLDDILHKGRVNRTEVLFPIDYYYFRAEGYNFKLSTSDISKKGTITVLRTTDSSGKLVNSLDWNSYLDCSDKNVHGQNFTMKDFLLKSYPVFADTWSCSVIQREGIRRLACTFVRTRKVANPSTIKRKPRKKTKTDISNLTMKEIFSAVRDGIEKDVTRKIRSLPPYFKIKLSHYSNFRIGSEWLSLDGSAPESAVIILDTWEKLSKESRRRILRIIASSQRYLLKEQILFKDIWKSHPSPSMREVFSKIVVPASKLKLGETENGTDPSIPSSEDSSASPSSYSRPTVGIILRTSSGSTRICRGEPSAEETGRNPDSVSRDQGQSKSTEGSEHE